MFSIFRKHQPQPTPALGVQMAVRDDAEQRSSPTDDPWAWAAGWGNCSVAAVDVSPFNALSCPPVLAAVNVIAGIAGERPGLEQGVGFSAAPAADLGIDRDRLVRIGWTKLAVVAENCDPGSEGGPRARPELRREGASA